MNKNKGFTLLEMIIVIAMIAIMVAIAIPFLMPTIEKAREARDAANIRSVLTEVTTKSLISGSNVAKAVYLSQTEAGWDYITEVAGYPTVPSTDDNPKNYSKADTCIPKVGNTKDKYTCMYVCVYANGEVKIIKGRPAAQLNRALGDFTILE